MLLFARAMSVVLAAFCICGCSAIRDSASPPGQMNADGTINPCHGFYTNPEGCGNAIYNASVMPKITLGMSIDQARAILKHAPDERQSDETLNNGRHEIWRYLTDYNKGIMTELEFRDGILTAKREHEQ